MENRDLAKNLYDFIKEHPGTSFVQIDHFFEKNNISYTGNIAIFVPDMGETVMWINWSNTALAIFEEFRQMPGVIIESCIPLIYYIDGKTPCFPVAKHNRVYTRPHWLPMAVSIKDEVRL